MSEKSNGEVSDIDSFEREITQIKALENVEAIEPGDFCLVRFSTKFTIMHYVSCVIKKLENEYEMKFLCPKKK